MLRWIGIIWFAATGIFAGAVCLLQLFVRTIDWSTRPQDAMDFPSRLRAAWLVVEPMLTTNALLSLILATSLTALSLLTFGPGLWRRFCSSRFGEIVGLASTRHPLVLVPPQPHINHSEALTNVKTGENVYHETYFIAVVNRSEDHETIKNLQLHVGFLRLPSRLPLRTDGEYAIDLQHGATAFFQLYKQYTSKVRSPVGTSRKVNEEEFRNAEEMAKFVRISIPAKDEPINIAVGIPSEPVDWPIRIMFTADDMAPLNVLATFKYDGASDVNVSCDILGKG